MNRSHLSSCETRIKLNANGNLPQVLLSFSKISNLFRESSDLNDPKLILDTVLCLSRLEPRDNERSKQTFTHFFSSLSLTLQFLTLLAIIGTTTARKIIIKSNSNRNSELFQDKDFTFSQDKDDKKEATIFKGDVMKSKTLISENVQGKKAFKFA